MNACTEDPKGSRSSGLRTWGPLITVTVITVAFSSCSSSGSTNATSSPTLPASTALPATTAPTITTTTPATLPAPTTTSVLSGGSTEPVMVPAGSCCNPGPTVLLTAVAAEHLAGRDRITFTLSAPVANYHVRYVPLPVKQDPSDQVVALQGDNAIQISMGATGTDQSANPPTKTYSGPTRLSVTGGTVIELVQTGDFEAVSNWAIGVRAKPAFRVSVGVSPSTLVIEVASS